MKFKLASKEDSSKIFLHKQTVKEEFMLTELESKWWWAQGHECYSGCVLESLFENRSSWASSKGLIRDPISGGKRV